MLYGIQDGAREPPGGLLGRKTVCSRSEARPAARGPATR